MPSEYVDSGRKQQEDGLLYQCMSASATNGIGKQDNIHTCPCMIRFDIDSTGAANVCVAGDKLARVYSNEIECQ